MLGWTRDIRFYSYLGYCNSVRVLQINNDLVFLMNILQVE